MARKIPAPRGGRVHTGAVQFGNDWPGLFIRGDDCLAFAAAIRQLLATVAGIENPRQLVRMACPGGQLLEVAELIEERVLQKQAGVQARSRN